MYGIHEKFRKHSVKLTSLTVAVAALALIATDANAQTRFQVRFAPAVRAEPFSGRIYLFFSRNDEPRRGPDWFRPSPMLAVDVENLSAGQAIDLSLSSTDHAALLA